MFFGLIIILIIKKNFGNNQFMKRNLETIESVRNRLMEIKGKDIVMKVNRGRRKIESFDAKLTETYTSVFMVKTDTNEPERSYSYTEVLCGNVSIYPKVVWYINYNYIKEYNHYNVWLAVCCFCCKKKAYCIFDQMKCNMFFIF